MSRAVDEAQTESSNALTRRVRLVNGDELTDSERDRMVTVLEQLSQNAWSRPLCDLIQERGGIVADCKPLLFEARVALAIQNAGVAQPRYEFATGVGDTTVDFRFGTDPVWLLEVVSIGVSDAVKAATVTVDEPLNPEDPHDPARRWTGWRRILSSPNAGQTHKEQIQSEEGESLLVVQKIGEKVYGKDAPVKFPPPQPNQFHAVIVDMRNHLDGGDVLDWQQIAYGGKSVKPWWRKYWIGKDGKRMEFCGVWDENNPMRFAATARERLHAIVFVAEEEYGDGSLLKKSYVVPNPELFQSNEDWKNALQSFPLKK